MKKDDKLKKVLTEYFLFCSHLNFTVLIFFEVYFNV